MTLEDEEDPETGVDNSSSYNHRHQEEENRKECQTRKTSDDLDLMEIVQQRIQSFSGNNDSVEPSAAAMVSSDEAAAVASEGGVAVASEGGVLGEAGYRQAAEPPPRTREPRAILGKEDAALIAREYQELTSTYGKTLEPAVGIPTGIISLRPGAYAVEGINGGTAPPDNSHALATTDRGEAGFPPAQRQQQHQHDLSVARPVESDANIGRNLPQAEQWDTGNPIRCEKCPRRVAVVVSCVGVAVLIVSIAVMVAILGNISNNNQHLATMEDTDNESNQMMISDKVFKVLPSETLKHIQDNRTPQYQAWQWILNDPLLEQYTSTDRVLQRFALATLYFATLGEGWLDNTSWLNYSVHECQWKTNDHHYLVCPIDCGNHGHLIFTTFFYHLNAYTFHPPLYLQYDFSGAAYEIPASVPCRNMSRLDATTAHHSDSYGSWRYEHLWMSVAGLDGNIPPEFFLLTSLKSFSFVGDPLEGSISTWIGRLSDLECTFGIESFQFHSLYGAPHHNIMEC